MLRDVLIITLVNANYRSYNKPSQRALYFFNICQDATAMIVSEVETNTVICVYDRFMDAKLICCDDKDFLVNNFLIAGSSRILYRQVFKFVAWNYFKSNVGFSDLKIMQHDLNRVKQLSERTLAVNHHAVKYSTCNGKTFQGLLHVRQNKTRGTDLGGWITFPLK